MNKSLTEKILEAGVENIRFFVPCRPVRYVGFLNLGFTSSDDPEVLQECEIIQDRYKVEDNYKITLVPLDRRFEHHHFYITDLNSLMQGHPDRFYMVNINPDQCRYQDTQ